MDADFAAMGWIGCHPCDNTASVHLRTSDLLALLADAPAWTWSYWRSKPRPRPALPIQCRSGLSCSQGNPST